MFDANLDSSGTILATDERKIRSRVNPNEPSDMELVETYYAALKKYGSRGEATSEAFKPIFIRYWSYVHNLAVGKLGALYAEDLAAETMSTVLERLNGKEVVSNLKGLVRHSFEREYANLLEKLFQGKKLMRAGLTSIEADSGAKVKGATMVSLNVSIGTGESDDLEMLNVLDDPTADVVEAAARRELVRVLHTLIADMPAQYRAPLVCQWLIGMRIKEVAEELGLTVDQVKHNTARGIKWLQKRMPGVVSDWVL